MRRRKRNCRANCGIASPTGLPAFRSGASLSRKCAVQPAQKTVVVEKPTMQLCCRMSFQDFGLSEEIVHGVQSMGYIDPTPIQLRAIPIVLGGRDLIGSAQTGTGKTAAFGLPILTKLKSHGACRCLILEPTRELAAQVETAFRDFARFTDLSIGLVHGGVGYGNQREDIKRGIDVLVATPGRLIDHLEQGTFNLKEINILVLDEVDRMLDMGFLPQVRRIVEKCPKD